MSAYYETIKAEVRMAFTVCRTDRCQRDAHEVILEVLHTERERIEDVSRQS